MVAHLRATSVRDDGNRKPTSKDRSDRGDRQAVRVRGPMPSLVLAAAPKSRISKPFAVPGYDPKQLSTRLLMSQEFRPYGYAILLRF